MELLDNISGISVYNGCCRYMDRRVIKKIFTKVIFRFDRRTIK